MRAPERILVAQLRKNACAHVEGRPYEDFNVLVVTVLCADDSLIV